MDGWITKRSLANWTDSFLEGNRLSLDLLVLLLVLSGACFVFLDSFLVLIDLLFVLAHFVNEVTLEVFGLDALVAFENLQY